MDDNKPSVVIVKDDEGLVHFTSPDSDLAKKYYKPEEVPSASVDAEPSDDRDARGTSGDRPGNRRSGDRNTDDAARGSGPVEPGSGD